MDEKEQKTRISRRDFLKAAGFGAGAVAAATAMGGVLNACTTSAAPQATPAKWDLTADVVVVGSGAAASAAATTSQSKGASVIMLEKGTIAGGTTMKSGGEIWIPNNFVLRKAGTPDPKADCLKFMARGNYPHLYNPSDPQLGLPNHEYNNLVAYYDNAAPAIDYMMQIGAIDYVAANSSTIDYLDHVPENKVPLGRGLSPNGGAGAQLIKQFQAYITAKKIQLLLSHRVQQIFLNDKREVVGVQALNTGATTPATVNVKANKAVIFGSGGFTHNKELIIQFQKGIEYGGCAVITNEGDLVYMGQAVGAQLSNMNGAWNAEIPLEQALQFSSTPNDIWQPAGDSMVLINKYGVRVTDEKRTYNDRTKIHFYWDPVQQEWPNLFMLMIYDQRNKDLYADSAGGYPIPPTGTTSPFEISGNTWQELTQNIRARITQLGAKVGIWKLDDSFDKNLPATIARFNGFANSGSDDDFHRGDFPYDVTWHKGVFSVPKQGTKWTLNDKKNITMYPFQDQGPYYCILLAGGTLDTNGGPRVNEKMQVLDTKETPIKGFYGAGNCIAPLMPYYIAAGSTIGNALTGGYIAATNAVQETPR